MFDRRIASFWVFITVVAVAGMPAGAAVVGWDFNTDGVFPDAEVPGTDHFTLNGTGTETVAGGLWTLDTSAATNIYNRYAKTIAIGDYGEVVVRTKVLGPTTDNGHGSTFGFVSSDNTRNIFSVNQNGVNINVSNFRATPTADDFHTFRLIHDNTAPVASQRTLLYEGTERIGSVTPEPKPLPGSNNAYFGDASNGGSMNAAVDFVEFRTSPPTSLAWDFNVDGVDPRDEEPGTVRTVTGSPPTSTVAGGVYRINTGDNSNRLYFTRRMDIDDYAEVWTKVKAEGTFDDGGHAGFRFLANNTDRAQFSMDHQSIQINEGAPVALTTNNRYHIYRMVYDPSQPAGSKTRVWQDGRLVASRDPQAKPGTEGFTFGDATGNGRADYSIDWIRTYTESTPLVLNYEHWWLPGALPENSDPAWSRRGLASNRTLVPGEYLNIDTPPTYGNGNDPDAYCDFEIFDQTDVLDLTKPTTLDIRMRVNSRSEGNFAGNMTFYEPEGSDTNYYPFYFDVGQVGGLDGGNWEWYALDTSMFHDYRVAVDPDLDLARLFIDGSDVPALTLDENTIGNFTRNGFFFGDGANSRAGNTDWAFVGWTHEGAFGGGINLVIPEPASILVFSVLLFGLAVWRRRRVGG